jgi:hypothetical protein
MPDTAQTLVVAAIAGAFVLFGIVLFGVSQWSKGAKR